MRKYIVFISFCGCLVRCIASPVVSSVHLIHQRIYDIDTFLKEYCDKNEVPCQFSIKIEDFLNGYCSNNKISYQLPNEVKMIEREILIILLNNFENFIGSSSADIERLLKNLPNVLGCFKRSIMDRLCIQKEIDDKLKLLADEDNDNRSTSQSLIDQLHGKIGIIDKRITSLLNKVIQTDEEVAKNFNCNIGR